MGLSLLEPGSLVQAVADAVFAHPVALGALAIAALAGALWFGLDHRK
ncbi:MAG: hypothetical protein H6811_05880 [Phycisphaeraceae bacterium]|nr:hypothetical protein [Phycisphaeraceae bacterium]